MKTLKIFLLCFIAVFAINTVNAQNRVIKEEITEALYPPQFLSCTGEYYAGDITFELMQMSHNLIIKFKRAAVLGYKDAAGTIPSGNVYEISEINPGLSFSENIVIWRLNGKVVAEYHFSWHITYNANGDITQEHTLEKTNCK
jgi:hypothetical protein